MEKSGYISRCVASCIDGAVLAACGALVGWLFLDRLAAIGPMARMLGFLFAAVYFSLGDSYLLNGCSLGKRICGLMVVTVDGKFLPLHKSFLRYSLFAIPALFKDWMIDAHSFSFIFDVITSVAVSGVTCANLYLFVFHNKNKQLLHDVVFSTVVVKRGEASEIEAGLQVNHKFVVGLILFVFFIGSFVSSPLVDERGNSPLFHVADAVSQVPGLYDVNVRGPVVSGNQKVIDNAYLISGYVKHRDNFNSKMVVVISENAMKGFSGGATPDRLDIHLNYGYDLGIVRYTDALSCSISTVDLMVRNYSGLKCQNSFSNGSLL